MYSIFYRIALIVLVAGTVAGSPVVRDPPRSRRFELKLDCASPPTDLSDLLSETYRDLAQPDGTNHVRLFYPSLTARPR